MRPFLTIGKGSQSNHFAFSLASRTLNSFADARENSEKVLPSILPNSSCPLVRRLGELEPVLCDTQTLRTNPELPVYKIYRDICGDGERSVLSEHRLRYDLTIMPPLMIGEEYVKTFGHDHMLCEGGWSHPEVFEVLEGEAFFLMQRRSGEEIVDVSLVTAREGDVVVVPPNCGHVMINGSSRRLVVGNLVSRDCVQVYRRFVEKRGASYFMLKGRRLVRNKNYSPLLGVRAATAGASGFVGKRPGLMGSFLKNPESFEYLNIQDSFHDFEKDVSHMKFISSISACDGMRNSDGLRALGDVAGEQ